MSNLTRVSSDACPSTNTSSSYVIASFSNKMTIVGPPDKVAGPWDIMGHSETYQKQNIEAPVGAAKF